MSSQLNLNLIKTYCNMISRPLSGKTEDIYVTSRHILNNLRSIKKLKKYENDNEINNLINYLKGETNDLNIHLNKLSETTNEMQDDKENLMKYGGDNRVKKIINHIKEYINDPSDESHLTKINEILEKNKQTFNTLAPNVQNIFIDDMVDKLKNKNESREKTIELTKHISENIYKTSRMIKKINKKLTIMPDMSAVILLSHLNNYLKYNLYSGMDNYRRYNN